MRRRSADLAPVIFLTGGPQPGQGAYPSLALDVALAAGGTRTLTWAQAALATPGESFEWARRTVARPWEAERSKIEMVNAAQTIERIIDIYPAGQQNQIRTMLANTLQAVISQTLFRRVDKPGMMPCTEMLLCTSAVRNCIRENRVYEIANIIETSRKFGMHTMDNSIADAYFKGYIGRDEAITRSSNPSKMEKLLKPTEHTQAVRPAVAAMLE